MGGVARVNLRRSLEMLFLVTAESDEAAHGRESLRVQVKFAPVTRRSIYGLAVYQACAWLDR
jgi:hypothetical protein